jgi:hypothetical protein
MKLLIVQIHRLTLLSPTSSFLGLSILSTPLPTQFIFPFIVMQMHIQSNRQHLT